MANEELSDKVQELARRVRMIERERRSEAEASKKAKELERWKELVPDLRKYYPSN